MSPNKLTEKTFDQIVTLMKEHFFTMQLFAFNSRSRKQGKSVATFVADLQRSSEYCKFGDSLVEMLRDTDLWDKQRSYAASSFGRVEEVLRKLMN